MAEKEDTTPKDVPPPPNASEHPNSTKGSLKKEICVKTSKDKTTCRINGMVLLNSAFIIITDYLNNAVKMVNTSNQTVIDQVQLHDSPWDITSMVANTELAVTLPDKREIQFVSIVSKKLTKKRIMEVRGACYCISFHQDKFVVSFCNPTNIQIIDINGAIQKTIEQNDFFEPRHVAINRCAIFVSDFEKKSVTKLNWQGEVSSRYLDMSMPYGIVLSDGGTVFACNMEEEGVIEEITGDCSTGKIILKNLKYPCDVCLCGETKKLYFSCYTGDEKFDNFLHIAELSHNMCRL